ncbi:MAG: hypothetical protein HY235_10980 [Acidobacteria bacterium]|nr:hypothetical protein [Acidobacteriota bacterium]
MNKRFILALAGVASGLLMTGPGQEALGAESDKAPVYIYLFVHTEDHINLDLSEERFRRLLPLIESYAAAAPQYGLSCSLQFYGADTRTLLERNPRNGILDFILSYKDRKPGLVEFGYHGAHEPTYTNSPVARLPRDASWEQRVEATVQLLSCAAHPYLGDTDCSNPGGLALVQQVFGSAAAISGGNETALAQAADKFNADAVMFGFADHGVPAQQAGYLDSVKSLMRLLSPEPDTPPALFWMDGRLRINDGNPLDGVEMLSGSGGVEQLKTKLARLDRSRPQVLNMIVGEKFLYARVAPTEYAYQHPDSPSLPPDLLLPAEQKEALYRRTEESLRYLVEEFFPQNPGSRFISNQDLLGMAAGPRYGQTVSVETVAAIAQALVAGWADRPPSFVRVGEAYFSLTDSFGLLTQALAAYARDGSLDGASQIAFWKVAGPLEQPRPSAQALAVRVADVLASASDLATKFRDRTWQPTPSYAIPSQISAGSPAVNAAEFLRSMAGVFLAVQKGPAPDSIQLAPSQILPRAAPLILPASLWSLKPARISTPRPANENTLDQIYFHIALNVNHSLDTSEQRRIVQTIRRHLDLVDKHRIKASYYFTGLAAEMVRAVDPTLLELLVEKSRAGLVTLAHQGANRPPFPMPIDRVKGEDWDTDVKAIVDYESCALDPRSGALDCSRPGGLKSMIANIFHQQMFSTGRFFQASILSVTKQLGVRMGVGLTGNTGAQRGDAWFLGMLNRPDSLTIAPAVILQQWPQGAPSPLTEIERIIAALDKTRIRQVTLVVHDTDFVQSPSPAQEEQRWQKYEELIQWALARKYRMLTLEELYALALDDRERAVSQAQLRDIAQTYVRQVEGSSPHYPPDFIDLKNDYFSLADAWQALAQALSQYRRTASLPDQTRTRDLLGPTVLVHLETATRTISADDILSSAAAALPEALDRAPSSVKLQQAGIEVNASEHLYLMAKEYLMLLNGPPAPVEVSRVNLISKNVENIGRNPDSPLSGRADALTRQQFWTYKPARWR